MSKETIVYKGFHEISVLETEVKGKKVTRERIKIKDAVAAVVIDETGKFGLVSQFRPAINQQTWELPAGLMDKEGLSPIQVLLEELEEECEIPQQNILEVLETPLHTYFMITGSSDAKLSIYLVLVTAQSDKYVQDADVDEVKWFGLEEVQSLINNGNISDSKTIIGYYAARQHLSKSLQ